MSSYLSSWLGYSSHPPAKASDSPRDAQASATGPQLLVTQDDKSNTDDDDSVPAFPSLGSIQRSSASTSPQLTGSLDKLLLDSRLMPPPSMIPLRGGLSPPPTTTQRPANVNTKAKARAKVALEPGHGPLDWARLKASGEDLRVSQPYESDMLTHCTTQDGVTTLLRITPSQLKEHNRPGDAWSSFGGKVYNITPYLPYHPGGQKELMRVAGRDGSKLFGP